MCETLTRTAPRRACARGGGDAQYGPERELRVWFMCARLEKYLFNMVNVSIVVLGIFQVGI